MIAAGRLKYESREKQHRYDVAYLRMAQEWSKLSHCKRKQVGAILVKNGMIISDGYNGAPAGFDNSCEDADGNTFWYVLHAEANAISKVARSTNNAQDSTLYLTMSPCKDCSKMILQVGIRRVVYSSEYQDNRGLKLLEEAGIETEYISLDKL